MNGIENKVVNTLRVLSADQIEKANSGHPGICLGAAPAMYALWRYHYRAYPEAYDYFNRDRFVLSAGHGSALYYSALHLFGFGMDMEDLKTFRQLGSRAAGHPEYEIDNAIDISTGPLGQGFASAVGMAIAEQRLAAEFNTEDIQIIDHNTYVLLGDGCLMEGISYEAAALAGNLKLGKLIVLFDSNNVTIDGAADISTSVDMRAAFKAYGWHVDYVEDGCDISAIDRAISNAKEQTDKPSFIEIKTTIGYGAPTKAGSPKTHGSPLGKDELEGLKTAFGFDPKASFEVLPEVAEYMESVKAEKSAQYSKLKEIKDEYSKKYPQDYKKLNDWLTNADSKALNSLSTDELISKMSALGDGIQKPEATRVSGSKVLNAAKKSIAPNLFGGSADLAASTKTYLDDCGVFSSACRKGDNLRYGIRELAMAAVSNGIAAHGGLRPFCSTFFVFSDYVKPALRLSAIMKLPVLYIMTHDSVAVGEDGPTHQPIEQFAMMRSVPNLNVFRPADAAQTAAAFTLALANTKAPSLIVLSRQNLSQLGGVANTIAKGACSVGFDFGSEANGIIIATGSETQIALEAQQMLQEKGLLVNVTSVLSNELFVANVKAGDKDSIRLLRPELERRLIVEASHPMAMSDFKTYKSIMMGIKDFGVSAPGDACMERAEMSAEGIVSAFLNAYRFTE